MENAVGYPCSMRIFVLWLVPLALPAAPPPPAALGTLTLADAPVLIVDPACNSRDGGSLVLQFRNDSPTVVRLALTTSEATTATSKPSGAKVALRPVRDLDGKTIAEIGAVDPGKSLYIRADVQDVLQDGTWDIEIHNHGIKIGTFKMVRASAAFNVKLDVPSPDAPEISLQRGVPKLLSFTNADGRAYPVSEEFAVDGKTDEAVSLPGRARKFGPDDGLVLPAGGAGEVRFIPPGEWFSWKSILKDVTADGRLTVRLRCMDAAGHACQPSPDAPARIFKVKLHLAICSPDCQSLCADLFVLLALLLGAGFSFAVNLVVPNYFSRRDFRARLSDIDARVAGLPMALSSRLRVLAGIERKGMEESVQGVSFYGLEFKGRIVQLTKAADQLSSRLDLLERLGRDRIRFEALRAQGPAPTIVDRIEDLFEGVIRNLDSVGLSDAVLQSVKASVDQIDKALEDFHKLGPDFAAALGERAKRLKKAFDKSQPQKAAGDPAAEHAPKEAATDPTANAPSTGRLRTRLPELFAYLAVAPEDPAGFASDYARWDMVLYKLDLIRRYVNWREAGSLADRALEGRNGDRFDHIEGELVKRLLLFSWEGVDSAQRYVREIEQSIFAETIKTQLSARRARIRMDRFAVRPFAPTQFRLDFDDPAYNTAEAQKDWTCVWHFDHGPENTGSTDNMIIHEYGWAATHYFPWPITYAVKVGFRPQHSNSGDEITPLEPLTVKVSVAPQQDGTRRRWHRRLAEAIQVLVAILPALAGLVAGAKDQVLKLDLIPAALAILVMGFGSDQIKNKLTQ